MKIANTFCVVNIINIFLKFINQIVVLPKFFNLISYKIGLSIPTILILRKLTLNMIHIIATEFLTVKKKCIFTRMNIFLRDCFAMQKIIYAKYETFKLFYPVLFMFE